MSLIEWKKEFETGIPDVDVEHEALIGLINSLYDSMNSDRSKDSILQFLGDIHTKTAAHFALEEKIMREEEYAHYGEHKNEHEQLLDDINDIMDEYEFNDSFDENKLKQVLASWFSEHFKNQDALFHKAL
ncbi:MAG: bacteriohemerythrin [Gammaproteobacteria bacterium]|nr:bacteriohemerythrin [Gammaproteobacteria bacterium]MDH5593005.1 bacteriohemerythrin [Gammaproteobacteria bacterium]